MVEITMKLDWNDIHKAITNLMEEKAKTALDIDGSSVMQSFVSFEDKKGNPINPETATILFKKYI